jgi:hypothetical protein
MTVPVEGFTPEEMEKLNSTPISLLAYSLEDALINAGTLRDDMPIAEFIKHYFLVDYVPKTE